MKPISDYTTIFNSDPEKLDKEVNELLTDGWELLGNPYSTTEGGSTNDGNFELFGCCYQAMVRRD